jgi:hypothetical protein
MYSASVWLHHVDVCSNANISSSFILFMFKVQWLKGIGAKCTLVQALRLCTGRTAHRGSGAIALPFLDHGTRREWGISVTPGRSLPPGKTRYPLCKRLGGPQSRSGQVRKISPPTLLDPRTVQPVASRCTRQRYPVYTMIKTKESLNCLVHFSHCSF